MRRLISPSWSGGAVLVALMAAVGCGSSEQPEAPPGQPIGPKTQDDALLAELMAGGGATAEPTAATAEPTAAPTASASASAAPTSSAMPKATTKPTAKPAAAPPKTTAAPTMK